MKVHELIYELEYMNQEYEVFVEGPCGVVKVFKTVEEEGEVLIII